MTANHSNKMPVCATGRFWFWVAVVLLCVVGGGTRLWQNHQREVAWRQNYRPMIRIAGNVHLQLQELMNSCIGPDLQQVKSFSRAELERELNGGKPFQFSFGGGGRDNYKWTVPGTDVTFEMMFENDEWWGYGLPDYMSPIPPLPKPPPFDLFTEKVQRRFVGASSGLGWGSGAWLLVLVLFIPWRQGRRASAEVMMALALLYATAWLTWPHRWWGTAEVIADKTFYFGVIMLAASAAAIFWSRRIAPLPWPACRNCGYNLTGNISCRCPECGQDV